MKPKLLVFFMCGQAIAGTAERQEFFESRIRPILAQECYECHGSATKKKGGLLLDSRPGWQAGGDHGAVIKPGDPASSLLIQAISHRHEDRKMPKNAAKLDDKVIADFEAWIRDGAFDPRDEPPSPEQLAKETDWNAVLARRKQWWAFQPLAPAPNKSTIDDFLDAALAERGIPPAPLADPATLRRRLSYVLTGLPPRGEASVDDLLASPAFGEKWARHFMDWVRYAESYGSEGDPAIPYAWRYRDYLIRAFNADVPWPRMIREAIAGDLLPDPRIKDGVNESSLGVGQLRMVLHGFSPVDSLDEMVTFTDNQIDTITKAFQALTVSCARCHNHKFDPISQADFYALYGVFTSTHPAVLDVNEPGRGDEIRAELKQLKAKIKDAVLAVWLKDAEAPTSPTTDTAKSGLDPFQWRARGLERVKAGEFAIALEGDRVIARVLPGGYACGLLSAKDRAVLFSQRFPCEGGKLWFRVAGGGGAQAKYVVQNYPRTGTVHKSIALNEGNDERLGWRSLDLDFWKGDEIFLQIATGADLPAEHREGRSWFCLTDLAITKDHPPPASPTPSSDPPKRLLAAWRDNALTNLQAEALDELLRGGRLPNKLTELPSAAALVQRYRELEAQLPAPTRAPGVVEADVKDAALFIQGNHKQPGHVVPRRYLEAIDPTPFSATGSGRLELANRIADMEKNPLTARVIVNRLWHHVFGRGIVTTTDNFGKLGEAPTHPELLDFLAQRFIESGGSIKATLKLMVSSKAFQRAVGAHPNDPENKLLGHWSIRRLEAEAIRDSMALLSGKLDPTMHGPSVGGADPRRSVYVRVIRNALDPFLTTFDAPVPFSARGRRDATNVPAQSLTLLNDPNVIRWSRDWASRALHSGGDDAGRVRQMFREAFGREANEEEVARSLAYLQSVERDSQPEASADDPRLQAWTSLAQSLINLKEFIYLN